MNTQTHVFEVVDATDEDRYYSLGVFLTEAEAMSLLDGKSPPYSDDNPDSVLIEVRNRRLGFHPHQYDSVASRLWVRAYDDERDSDWEANPIIKKA